MKKYSAVAIIILFGYTFLNAAWKRPDEKIYRLEYKMVEGTKFSITADHNYERETILPDGNLTGNTIDDTFVGDFHVISSDADAGMVLSVEIIELHRESINPGGSFREDFAELTGSRVEFAISPRGEILHPEVFNALPQQELFLRVSAPDHYLHRIHSFLPILPAAPVKIGDTWTSTLEAVRPWGELGVKVTSKNSYQILEETRFNGVDCLKIAVAVKQASKAEGERWGRNVSAEYEGTGEEVFYFAPALGMVLGKEGSMQVKGRLMQSDQTDTIKYGWKVKFAK